MLAEAVVGVPQSTVPERRSDTSGNAGFGRSCKRSWHDARSECIDPDARPVRGATPCDGQQHFDMLPADPLAASLEEGSSRGADEIGHLQGRPAHLLLLYGAVFQLQRVQRAGGRVKMALRKMQIDGGLFQIAVAQQDLNGAQIGACFEQMSGEAVTQRVAMDLFLDAGSLGGLLAGVPDGLGVDGLITALVAVTRKQPYAGFSPQPMPMCTEFFQQLGTEQHIAISAPLAALYMNHHALAVDVVDFQARQLRVPDASGVERHEKDALVGRTSGVDQLRDFLLAEDRREAMCLFRVGRFGDAPGPVESLGVEKTQSRQAGRDSPRRQLPLLKQLRLIFANLPRPQAVRREIESPSKILDGADVTTCGIFRVITALEFLQHSFS